MVEKIVTGGPILAKGFRLDILFSKNLAHFLTVRAPGVSRSEEDPPVRVVSEVVARGG